MASILVIFLTEMGDLILQIQRTRKRFISKVLEAYKKRSPTVDQLIMVCFVLGMRKRKVSTALLSSAALLGS
jgi:transposase-like protein